MDANDPINPDHYTKGISAHAYISSWDMVWEAANVTKYITRYRFKNPNNPLQDLEKAQWYLEALIAKVEREMRDV